MVDSITNHSIQMNQKFTEVYQHMVDHFDLNRDQRLLVRVVCQDLIYQPTCIAYKMLHINVEAKLRENKEQYQIQHIIGHPARKQKLLVNIKEQCRHTRNHLREMLRDSVLGKNTCPLDDFLLSVANRFKHEGGNQPSVDSNLYEHERNHMSILRRFARENAKLLNVGDKQDESSSSVGGLSVLPSRSGAPDISASPNITSHKRKLPDRIGPNKRMGREKDFWESLDAWFSERVHEWGKSLDSPKWQQYITDTVQQDLELYKPQKTLSNMNLVGNPSSLLSLV